MSLKFCYYIPRTVMAFKTSTFFSQIRTICSATQLSRNRVDFLNVGVKFKNIINSVGALPKRPLTLLVGSGRNLAANCKKESLFNTANQGRKLSATTVWLSKSFQRDQSKSRDKRGMLCRMFLGALGVSATATCCIHTGAQVTMAAGPDALKGNLESAKGDWRETKDLLLSLTVDERRQYYMTPGYKTLDSIPTWSPSAGEKPRYSRNKKLDGKISLYSGDITQLEIDAIVNAANKTLLGGGGVDGAIHRAAGPKLKEECASLIGCETGEAKVTGGYGLPAKYVIHTVGPVAVGAVGEEERQALRACYKNSLEAAAATLTGARSLAFPCISTGIYGYPPEQAVHEALATVREYLDEHPDKLDRVIFCVFLTSDKELYLKNLPLYFPGAPAEARVKSKL